VVASILDRYRQRKGLWKGVWGEHFSSRKVPPALPFTWLKCYSVSRRNRGVNVTSAARARRRRAWVSTSGRHFVLGGDNARGIGPRLDMAQVNILVEPSEQRNPRPEQDRK